MRRGPLKGRHLVLMGVAAAIGLAAATTDLTELTGAGDEALVATLADGRTGAIRFKSYQPTRRELARGNHRDRKSTRLNSSHSSVSRMPSSA